MKRILFLVLVFATGAVVAVCSLQVKERDTFLDANVEALAQQESGGADNNYRFEREDGKCRINVGVGGKIILKRTGLILNANTNGYVEFDGKVACKLGGSYECRTIECVDLYQVIFD